MVTAIKGNDTSTFGGNVDVTGNVITDAPAFAGYSTTGQVISNGTFTKLQIDAEDFDTNSNYDHTTNYRFTPTVAGYYLLSGRVEVNSNPSNSDQLLAAYKNGSNYAYLGQRTGGNAATRGIGGNLLIYANGTTDYFELYYYQSTGGTLTIDTGTSPRRCQFSGFLARAV